jgi:hypothetical protein
MYDLYTVGTQTIEKTALAPAPLSLETSLLYNLCPLALASKMQILKVGNAFTQHHTSKLFSSMD